jgi:hypothetical protein
MTWSHIEDEGVDSTFASAGWSEYIDVQGVLEYWNTGSSGTKSKGIDEMAFSFGSGWRFR